MRYILFFLIFLLFVPSWANDTEDFSQLITHGPRQEAKVALTFDGCYNTVSEYDEQIVEILNSTQTKATFFLSGRWAEPTRTGRKAIAENPLFEIAGHGFYHPHFVTVSAERIEKEFTKMKAALKKITAKTLILPATLRRV